MLEGLAMNFKNIGTKGCFSMRCGVLSGSLRIIKLVILATETKCPVLRMN